MGVGGFSVTPQLIENTQLVRYRVRHLRSNRTPSRNPKFSANNRISNGRVANYEFLLLIRRSLTLKTFFSLLTNHKPPSFSVPLYHSIFSVGKHDFNVRKNNTSRPGLFLIAFCQLICFFASTFLFMPRSYLQVVQS